MSEEELNKIRYDLLQLCDRLKEFTVKFFSVGEKGPTVAEPNVVYHEKVHPEKESITTETEITLRNLKVWPYTSKDGSEKSFLLEDTEKNLRAFYPRKGIKQQGDDVILLPWAVKSFGLPKWKPIEERFWE